MKMLRLRAYYAPEVVSSSHMTKDTEEAFVNAGFSSISFTPTPTRGVSKEVREKYKKIKHEEFYNGQMVVKRFSMFGEGKNPILRALRYFLCAFVEYFKGISQKDIDIIYSGSTPPIQGMLCAAVAKRLSKKYKKKVPFVYNLQDVFPDSLVSTGLAKKGSILWKIGRKVEDFTYNNAEHIIVISDGIKRNIMEKGVPEQKITVVSNWIDTESVFPVSKEENKLFDEFSIPRDKFIVLYAGNFGASQGTSVILETAELLKDNDNIQFVLFGGGSGFEGAKNKVSEKELKNVIINPLLPQDRISEVYSLGDVALITCKKGVGSGAMPSKTWSIMACNTPIIASFDKGSDLEEALTKSGAGICVEPQNPNELAKAIEEFLGKEKTEIDTRSYVLENASRDICVGKYIEVLKGCVK